MSIEDLSFIYVLTLLVSIFSKNYYYYFLKAVKEYIIESNGFHILTAFTKNQCLSDKDRKELVRILTQFLVKKFGFYPSKEEKLSVAKIAVDIFPSYKSSSKYLGAVIFINLRVILKVA